VDEEQLGQSVGELPLRPQQNAIDQNAEWADTHNLAMKDPKRGEFVQLGE
jgi:hypothetical protein